MRAPISTSSRSAPCIPSSERPEFSAPGGGSTVMKVVIAGGTGFLGRPLTHALSGEGHDVVVLSRGRGAAPAGARVVSWSPDGRTGSWASTIDGADVVVNLAGESIAARRWTSAHK